MLILKRQAFQQNTFNRTIVELKFQYLQENVEMYQAFNRTIVELKYAKELIAA